MQGDRDRGSIRSTGRCVMGGPVGQHSAGEQGTSAASHGHRPSHNTATVTVVVCRWWWLLAGWLPGWPAYIVTEGLQQQQYQQVLSYIQHTHTLTEWGMRTLKLAAATIDKWEYFRVPAAATCNKACTTGLWGVC